METLTQSRSPQSQISVLQDPAARLFAVCALSFCVFFLATSTAAQAPATQPPSKPPVKLVRPHKAAAVRTAQPAPFAPVAVSPPPPPAPHWPLNDQPKPASVLWDSHGLRIDAANSSLEQILKEVSVVTGVKVEGLSSDERVFGAYGPGQPRDVLAELLQGSSYNVIMVGDQGEGAPRQLLLSVRHAGETQPAGKPNSSPDEDNDVDESSQQPQQIPPPAQLRPNFTPGAPPRTPQQIMQELQERQQELQQRQQQSLPNPDQK